MLVVTGIFDNELTTSPTGEVSSVRFIPDMPITIPKMKKVVVTIDDNIDSYAKTKKANRRAIIDELCGMFSDGKTSVDDFIKQKALDKGI